MIDSYVPSPIPFYVGSKRSDWRRRSCVANLPYTQAIMTNEDTDINIDTGIDIRIEADPVSVTSFTLLAWGGGDSIPLDESVFSVSQTTDGAFSIYLQPAFLAAPGVQLNTHYYFEVVAGGITFESECIYTSDFTVYNFPADCNDDRVVYTKIAWSSECGVNGGGAVETGGYAMYVDAEVGRPEWVLVEEGEEDAEGQEVVDYQRIRKRMSLQFYGTQYVADALTHTLLYETRQIVFDDGLVWNFRDPKVEMSWEENGCEASGMVDFSFEIDGLSRFGCANDCP